MTITTPLGGEDMMGYFVDWLAKNNLHETEGVLRMELQKSASGKSRKLGYPFETGCGDTVSFDKNNVEHSQKAPLVPEKADNYTYDSHYVDRDEWQDPDDLGYVRIPQVPKPYYQQPPRRTLPPHLDVPSSPEHTGESQNSGESDLEMSCVTSPVSLELGSPDKEAARLVSLSPEIDLGGLFSDVADLHSAEENLGAGGNTPTESPHNEGDRSLTFTDTEEIQLTVPIEAVQETVAEGGETTEPEIHVELAHVPSPDSSFLNTSLPSPTANNQSDLYAQPAVAEHYSQYAEKVAPIPLSYHAAATQQIQHQQLQQQPQPIPGHYSYPPMQSHQPRPPVYEAFSLKIIYEQGKTGFEAEKDFPIQMYSVIAGRYQIVEFLGSAAFSRAVQCLDLKTGQLVCVKIIRNSKDFLDQGLDEIKLLHFINANGDPDENRVVQLIDYFYYKEHLMIVCELLRDNLYEFSKFNRESGDELYFTLPRLQRIARQCLIALRYIHSLNLIHCDLKPENILIKSYSRCEVKVIDFGSSCFITDHLSSYVQSRCYRAPEVILGLPWDGKIDIWSLGAILPELLTGRVLFHNDSLATMIARIVAICGDFPTHILRSGRHTNKFFTEQGVPYEVHKDGQIELLYPKRTQLRHRVGSQDPLWVDFLTQLLQIDPRLRPTADQALHHPFLYHDYGPVLSN